MTALLGEQQQKTLTTSGPTTGSGHGLSAIANGAIIQTLGRLLKPGMPKPGGS